MNRGFTALSAANGLIAFVFWMYGAVQALEPPGPSETEKAKKRVSAPGPEEITKLVEQLGEKSFDAREAAAKRLVEIGLAALPQLRKALEHREAEVRRRCLSLIEEIEKRNQLKTVNGVEFRMLASPVWKLPKPGGQTKVTLGLRFTNRGEKAVYFYLVDTVSIKLSGDKAGEIRLEGGRNSPSGLPIVSPALKKGESFTSLYRDAKLRWEKDGTSVRFVYVDRAPREYWCFPSLSPGKYSIRLTYENASNN